MTFRSVLANFGLPPFVNEGAYNKIFLLSFSDRPNLIARIPSRLAGPAHLTTASEVATMAYAREILDLPVPRVIAWSSQAAATPVGSEFILMEQVEGVQVGTRTAILSDPREVKALIRATLQFHDKLLSAPLSQVGSIYFKEDVSKELQDRPFYRNDFEGDQPASERFRIGPTVKREFWSGQRTTLNLDRGPCEFPHSPLRRT